MADLTANVDFDGGTNAGAGGVGAPGGKFPFKGFALNEVWLEIVMIAHDLIVWTQALLLDGELTKAEPKRLRYRLLHVAGRLTFSGRRGKLHLPSTWPWATDLIAAFTKPKALTATS